MCVCVCVCVCECVCVCVSVSVCVCVCVCVCVSNISTYLVCATSHIAQLPLATPPTRNWLLGDQSTDRRGGVSCGWVWLDTSSVMIGT